MANRGRVKGFGVAAAVVVAACVVVLFVRAARNDFGMARNMEIMVNLMRALQTDYVDEVKPDDVMRKGAAGICSSLDPYTTYLPEEDMSDFTAMTTGKYGGIGAMIRQDSNLVRIAEPYKGSPADRAGLQIGDLIVAIDGKDVTGKTTSDVSALLRGEPHTTVRVAVQKLTTGERVEKKIRRERIAIPSVSYAGYVEEGTGYIRHSDFTDGCYDEMRAAVVRLQSEGRLERLILDYRSNGGGVMQSAVKVLSLFVPKGTTVLSIKGRAKGETRTFATEYEPLLPDVPIAVLINSNSASAAEIVAGALQDLDRAVLLGQRSFGKGLVQSTVPLGYNSYLKVTTAKYYIPSGRCIQAVRYSSEGRAETVPDSLITEFRTAGGRKVYDGGGIKPDRHIEPEMVSSFAATLYLMGIIDDFGDDYFRRNASAMIDPHSFSITDADYADFVRMVEGRDVPYKSESRRALERLRTALAKERRTGEGVAQALEQIDKQLGDDKQSNLTAYRKDIVRSINDNIILRYAYSEGVIASSLSTDREVCEAAKLLRDREQYRKILSAEVKE